MYCTLHDGLRNACIFHIKGLSAPFKESCILPIHMYHSMISFKKYMIQHKYKVDDVLCHILRNTFTFLVFWMLLCIIYDILTQCSVYRYHVLNVLKNYFNSRLFILILFLGTFIWQALEAGKLLIRSHQRSKLEMTNQSEFHMLIDRWSSNECQRAITQYLETEADF